jgi:hypothetical protein
MVNSQIMSVIATVLASVAVPMKHVAPGKANFFIGDFHIRPEANDGGKRELSINKLAVVLNGLSFSLH